MNAMVIGIQITKIGSNELKNYKNYQQVPNITTSKKNRHKKLINLGKKFLYLRIYATNTKTLGENLWRITLRRKFDPHFGPHFTWYVAHHRVFLKQEDTKRIAYDCAINNRSIFLNDILLKFPELTSLLNVVLFLL